ncbi:type 2 periplasmic-binding domain-containing protein [Vallitalea okinawensis]|uniref:extracellular solute-binding protein n=1 Tax=Vallitalea okinawensis TaxID=2078660 RepID=UPI000CFBD7AC|nr:extracellular solute-binding protein [Vallitalea okinawensis]
MKRILALLLILTLSVSLIACTGQKTDDTNVTSDNQDEVKKETKKETKKTDSNIVYDGTFGQIVNEPAEISIFAKQDGGFSFTTDSTFANFYEEATGVKLIGTANPNVDDTTDLNLHATEGFPSDIISVAHLNDAMVQFANEGAFVDLNQYMDLMPNTKNFFENHPLGQQIYEASVTPQGELFLIASAERFKPTHVPLIRKDWLEKVGMEVPQTTEELEEVLLAFKDNNLGAGGITVPFVSKAWVLKQNLPPIFGARTESRATGRVIISDDGSEFYHGWSTNEFRHALTETSRWYDIGIFSKELFTEDDPKNMYFPSDRGGFTIWSASTIGFNDQPNMPEGFELVPMLPTEFDGQRLDQRATHFMRKGRIGISSSSKNVELAAAVLDSFLTEELIIQNAYGIIGEQIELVDTVDGIRVYQETKEWNDLIYADFNNNSKTARYDNGFLNIGITPDVIHDTFRHIKYGEEFGKSPVDEIEKIYLEAYASGEVNFVPGVPVSFTSEEQDEINNIKTNLEFYQDEAFAEAITNAYTQINDTWWNNYITKCNEIGMERLVEIYNTALDRNR